MSGFFALLGLVRAGFTAPSFAIFTDLMTGWVCAPGRRTITAMITVAVRHVRWCGQGPPPEVS